MSGREDVFNQAMSQGHSAAWDQNWDRAATFYRQALSEFPDHPGALTSLGLAMFELQNHAEALKAYSKAAVVTPDDPLPVEKVAQLTERIGDIDRAAKASLYAGDLYLKKQEIGKAIENWARVTRLKPQNLIAHSRLALTFERLGRKQPAVTEYLAVASLMQNSGELDKAVQAVNHALIILPNSAEAHQALGMLRDSKPLPMPARARGSTGPLRMSQVRQMEDTQAQYQHPGLDPIAEARQKALSALASLLFEPPPEQQEYPEQAKRGLGAIARGKVQSQVIKQVDNQKVMLYVSQVIDLQTRGQEAEAAGELEHAMEAGLDHSAANYDLGLLLSHGEQLEQALSHLKKAALYSDYALATHLLMGEVNRKLVRLNNAAHEYLEALKLADSQVVPESQADELRQLYDPLMEEVSQGSEPQAFIQLCDNVASLLVRADWREQLLNARKSLPVEAPGSPPLPLGEILTAARSSRIIEAISAIRKLAGEGHLRSAVEEAYYALQFAPTYLPLHTYLGELLIQQDRVPEAISKFMVISQTYNARGEAERSIDLLKKVVELAPMDLNARNHLIQLLIEHGLTNEAITQYQELAGVYYNLADLAKSRKTYTEALRLAQQADADRAVKAEILYQMADIDLQSLDWRQALRIYEQLRTLQPDDRRARFNIIELNLRLGQESQAMAELNNYLSYLSNRGERRQIFTFLEELVREIPDQAVLRRPLAEAYRQTGRKDDAIAQYDAIGEIYLDRGNRPAAIQAIETILKLDPKDKAQYEQLLDNIKGT